MGVDEAALSAKYDLVKLHITGSTQISAKTSAIISKLSTSASSEKTLIVVLTANSRYANKLISIVEITKRQLDSDATKCFQYNALTSEMREIERKNPEQPRNGTTGVKTVVDDDESDEAFETMGSRSDPKKRTVPIMTTYLSNVPVKVLKAAYSEQR